MVSKNPNVEVFNVDAKSYAGYLYTTNTKLSSVLATGRSTEVILEMARFTGRSVLDVGCGDAFYALRFWDRSNPKCWIGVDAAAEAVMIAKKKKGNRQIQFMIADVHQLPYPDDRFDLALLQSILHHDSDPVGALREAFRLAPEVLIHEPNGMNFGLKVIEKTSDYHRAHREKSYTLRQLVQWVDKAGGRVVNQKLAGFVPMFCSEWVAKSMKALEPFVEKTHVVSAMGCAICVLVAVRKNVRMTDVCSGLVDGC